MNEEDQHLRISISPLQVHDDDPRLAVVVLQNNRLHVVPENAFIVTQTSIGTQYNQMNQHVSLTRFL